MASRAWLSEQQKDRAARIAREKDLSCPDCGSSEPVPKDEARMHPDGGADIAMRCVNCERASEVTLVLSPEEAKALGLGHALRDRPEVP
jgi:hypothetical protein